MNACVARLRLWVSSLYLPVCMTTLRTKIIRLAHQNPALRPHLLPLLKEAALKVASKKPLYGHDKMDNACVVDDYPYGSLRTKIRFWLEKSPSKGFRFVSQTLNPKTGKWNAPKPSTVITKPTTKNRPLGACGGVATETGGDFMRAVGG